MADFYSILRKSILDRGIADGDERDAIYAQARRAMIRRLWSFEPPLADEEIDRRIAAFDVAVSDIEADVMATFSTVDDAPAEADYEADPYEADPYEADPYETDDREPDAYVADDREPDAYVADDYEADSRETRTASRPIERRSRTSRRPIRPPIHGGCRRWSSRATTPGSCARRNSSTTTRRRGASSPSRESRPTKTPTMRPMRSGRAGGGRTSQHLPAAQKARTAGRSLPGRAGLRTSSAAPAEPQRPLVCGRRFSRAAQTAAPATGAGPGATPASAG